MWAYRRTFQAEGTVITDSKEDSVPGRGQGDSLERTSQAAMLRMTGQGKDQQLSRETGKRGGEECHW